VSYLVLGFRQKRATISEIKLMLVIVESRQRAIVINKFSRLSSKSEAVSILFASKLRRNLIAMILIF